MDENMKCGECRCFEKDGNSDIGRCLFNPPVIFQIETNHKMTFVSKRPSTRKDDYCSKAKGIFVDPDV